jgi:hypothetical protein
MGKLTDLAKAAAPDPTDPVLWTDLLPIIGGIEDQMTAINAAIYALQNQPRPAFRARLNSGGSMSVTMTVDTTDKELDLAFDDDQGNLTNPPVGATILFVSSNEAIATAPASTVNADGYTLNAPILITPGAGDIGEVDFSVTILDSEGAPVLEPDGVTAFQDSAGTVTIEVDPGAAAIAVLGEGSTDGPSGPSGPTGPVYYTVPMPSGFSPDPAFWTASGFNDGSTPPNELYTAVSGANNGQGNLFTGTPVPDAPDGPSGPSGPSGPAGGPTYYTVSGTPDPVVWIDANSNDGSTPPNELYTLAPGQADDGNGTEFDGLPVANVPDGPSGPTGSPGPSQAVYEFIGPDVTTIDPTAFSVAPWQTDTVPAATLYYFIGADATTIDPTQWSEYTGTADAVPAGS